MGETGILYINGVTIPVVLNSISYDFDRTEISVLQVSNNTERHKIKEQFDAEMIVKYGCKKSDDNRCLAIMNVFENTSLKESDIKDVIFNRKATIVLWKDGTKTVVKCQPGDKYSPEAGLAIAVMKKVFGNKGNYNNVFKRLIAKAKKEG